MPNAEPYDVAELTRQDRELDFDRFGHAEAWRVGQWIVTRAYERSHPITTALWLGEQRVFHAGLPGSTADNDSWVERKAAVVRRYDASSLLVSRRWRSYGVEEESPRLGLDPRLHILSGGGFPIRLRGTLVGVAVVSGLEEQADHDLVRAALRHALGTDTTDPQEPS